MKIYAVAATAVRQYLEADRGRADDYYLTEGTGIARRFTAGDGRVEEVAPLAGDGYEAWVAGQDPENQVVLVLRWLRHRLDLRLLAHDAGVSIATAYRYLHEALEVIAAHAPDLGDVLARARATHLPFLCLDGTLVPTDRVAARAEAGHHLWYSGNHHAFGGNVQVLCDPTGFPLWVSDVRPGSTTT